MDKSIEFSVMLETEELVILSGDMLSCVVVGVGMDGFVTLRFMDPVEDIVYGSDARCLSDDWFICIYFL